MKHDECYSSLCYLFPWTVTFQVNLTSLCYLFPWTATFQVNLTCSHPGMQHHVGFSGVLYNSSQLK